MYKPEAWCILIITISISLRTHAQQFINDYEEVPVVINVQKIGVFELSGIIPNKSSELYLPVCDLFKFLKIKCNYSLNFDTVSGYFIEEKYPYLINYENRVIIFESDTINLNIGDIVCDENGLYLSDDIYGQVFGLKCAFNSRTLIVDISTEIDLPAIKELRLQQIRQNLERLKGKIKVDTTIGRNYHLFRPGMIDWELSSIQSYGKTINTRLEMGIGTELLFGETNILLAYDTRSGFPGNNQQYYWRWVNNNKRVFKQIKAGHIGNSSIVSVYKSVKGISATNAPSTYRRSFGIYTIAEYTEPGWVVELSINNVIIDYVTSDAMGLFKFDIPLMYGTSDIKLKFYGPYGEERSKEKRIFIPFNFLPKGEIEYTVNAGIVDDIQNSVISHNELNYGISRFITVGGGVDFSKKPNDRNVIPFIKSSFTPHPFLLITGMYYHGVVSKAILTFRNVKNQSVEFGFSRYSNGQTAINVDFLEEQKISAYMPVRLGNYYGHIRFKYNRQTFRSFINHSSEFAISFILSRFSANLSTYANWKKNYSSFLSSQVALSVRLTEKFRVRSETQLNYSKNYNVTQKLELEKRLTNRGYFLLTTNKNLNSGSQSYTLTFRYDFPCAQVSFASRVGKHSLVTSQGANGSIAMGLYNNCIHADNRSTIGRGGLTIIPFLDINFNERKDDSEPFVSNLNVRINGGRPIFCERDSLERLIDLEPYTNYMIEVHDGGLENISWQVKNKKISIVIDPNQFKRLYIPVLPMGEITGTIYKEVNDALIGLGRILVNIHDSLGNILTTVMSEKDGYYSYLGLSPAKYYVKVDSLQLSKLNLLSSPEKIEFEIMPSSFGSVIDGLDFVLKQNPTLPIVLKENEVIVESQCSIKDCLRFLIMAQNAFIRKDYCLAMEYVNKSLSICLTGEATALKGSIYYMWHFDELTQVYWKQAKELAPNIIIPTIQDLDKIIIR